MNNTSSKNSMQEFHDDTILSYKDFVIKYDIVSLNTSLDVVDYCYSFLCFLQEMGIQERYQFVFPLFYDFSISKGVENRDLINLSNKEDRAYYWLIDPSIIEDVEKHSEYGLGITDSYCNSNIGPSFLEITKEDENTITVSANLYKNLSFEDAFLYISKIKDFDNGRVVQEVIGARNGNARLEDIDSIDLKFVFDEENNSEYHLLEKNIEFKNGIKSHFPVFSHGNKYLYYFFTNNLQLCDGEKRRGFGGLFVISDKKLSDREKGFFILSGYTLANKMAFSQMWRSARAESIKSAKSAIMSRNMSHNIGSHVMSYLKQKLGSITAIISEENEVLYNLTDNDSIKTILKSKSLSKPFNCPENIERIIQEKYSKDPIEKINDNNELIQLPFLVGTGRFLAYLQERQDYIATIATDYIPYGAPINLKDAIYDELNPDLRFMRHKVDDGNRPMNVLLSYIAKSEGLSRENMNNCKKAINASNWEKFNTNNDILFGFPKYEKGKEKHIFGLSPDNCASDDPALTEMRKINFSLPGGLVGRQAVFSILENLIRNAAKHGNPLSSERGNLELTLDVIDLDNIDETISIEERICDPVWRALYKAPIDYEPLYLLTITDNILYPNADMVLAQLKKALNDNYLDDLGNMKPTNKGIKEIRISAAWIRGEVDEDRYLKYDDFENNRKAIEEGTFKTRKKAPLVGVELADGHLRYMICLPQDRLAAVIVEGMNDEDRVIFEVLEHMMPKDWKIYNTVAEAVKDNKISYHYMLVSHNNYAKLRPKTSNRLFIWEPTNEEHQELITIKQKKTDSLELYTAMRNAIIRQLYHFDSESEPIYIWDDKAYDNFEKCTDKEFKLKGKIVVAKSDNVGVVEAQYAYRTHHSTDIQFETYWKKKKATDGEFKETYSKIICIDAITGDNSSDRIVRREPITEEWYCSHLRALKKRVAIFDERLFKIVHNVDENKFIINAQANHGDTLSLWIQRLQKGEDYNIIKNEIYNSDTISEDAKFSLTYLNDLENIVKYLISFKKTFEAQEASNIQSIIYKEKGVDVFTIVREKDNTFAVIGFVDEITDVNGHVTCTYDKVATITYMRNPFEVIVKIENKNFMHQYDYISIHQGILDKLYEGFNIKEAGKKNDPHKCLVTLRIHNVFMKELEEYKPIVVEDGDSDYSRVFLPCFIIHSGRAKPTRNDMPQDQPFVQYAAIEHGVQDCKYALIELLDYARFEN